MEQSLDATNRWYKLAQAIPWGKIERVYNQGLENKHCGGGNKPARMVIGALIIKHKMNLSDEETIQTISVFQPHVRPIVRGKSKAKV